MSDTVTIGLAPASIHELRRTGDDIEARPDVYAGLLATEPGLRDLVLEFARSWRMASGALAMCALLARRSDTTTLDVLAFLRLIGRDVRQNPGAWTSLAQSRPQFDEDSSRLAQTLREAIGRLTPTAYA